MTPGDTAPPCFDGHDLYNLKYKGFYTILFSTSIWIPPLFHLKWKSMEVNGIDMVTIVNEEGKMEWNVFLP